MKLIKKIKNIRGINTQLSWKDFFYDIVFVISLIIFRSYEQIYNNPF